MCTKLLSQQQHRVKEDVTEIWAQLDHVRIPREIEEHINGLR